MFINIPRKQVPILFKLIIGLGAVVVLLLISIGYSYHVAETLYHDSVTIERSDSVASRLDLLRLKLTAGESNLLAYATAGDQIFLINYHNARKASKQYLKDLQGLTEDYTPEREKIDTLQMYIRERFRLMDKVVAIRRDGAEDKLGEKRRVGMARKLMNQIDSTSVELQQILERKANWSKAESKEQLRKIWRANHAIALLGGIIAALLGVLVYKDFQQREKIEQQLRTLNNQKSQFFSIISHDLRGPTRNTKVLLEMMNDPTFATSPEESRKMTGMAVESAQQTHRLLEDLLTWGRLQMDQVGMVTTMFKPFESADKVCGALQATARLKNISLHNQIPRHLKVRADVNMVETVIRNLVSNAIKFTPESGQVQIKAREAGSYVELVVEDNGVGIVPEVVEKIFTFHTKHSTRGTAGEAGTGLGLAFCREFVERNGGTISVESQVGIGSKFNVRLPLADLRESA